MQQLIGFHALFEGQMDDGLTALDEAASGFGLAAVAKNSGGYPQREYRGARGGRLDFSVRTGQPWSQFLMGPLEASEFHACQAGLVVDVLGRLCDLLSTPLGRSYKGGGAGHGLVRPQEVEGGLAFVDWMQYLGPGLVKRWGAKRLLGGPFHRVDMRANGACILMLGASPFEGLLSRQAAADYLGITLPPLEAKDFHGRPIVLKWP